MTKFWTFASGSTGNASLLVCGEVAVLIDIGISCRRILQHAEDAGRSPEDLTALVVTHEHEDHVSGLRTYTKRYSTPIFCSRGTGAHLDYRLERVLPLLRPLALGKPCDLGGGVTLTLHPTSHDSSQSTAVRLDTPDGSVAVLTDTGVVPEETGAALLWADILLLEANHDVERLRAGPYSYVLKHRILGPEGHLSNAAAARYAAESVRSGTRTVLLAHLSEENNTPALAREAVEAALAEAGLTARVVVVPHNTASEAFTLEKSPCGV